MCQFMSLGQVATKLGETPSRIKYAIALYRIPERQRAGIIRLWTDEDLPTIRSALRRVAERSRVRP